MITMTTAAKAAYGTTTSQAMRARAAGCTTIGATDLREVVR